MAGALRSSAFRSVLARGRLPSCPVISRLRGEVIRVEEGVAEVRADALVYEVLVPAADEERLRGQIGETVEFHTLHYLEGQGQGSSFWPRLIGFRSPLERDFFELFTTVKGIGNRKALRALQMPFGMVAELIVRRDVSMLTTLPEIGRKTAETIVVELKGKVERFTVLGRGQASTEDARSRAAVAVPSSTKKAKFGSDASAVTSAVAPKAMPARAASSSGVGSDFTDAIEILVQLGESRLVARQLVERALDRDADLRTADAIVAAALRAR